MTREHDELFNRYQCDLIAALEQAQTWWNSLHDSEIRLRWPDGPASHPIVIGVIINYMHACDRLNRTVADDERVYLNEFLIDGLLGTELGNRMTLSYWPLGTYPDGRPI